MSGNILALYDWSQLCDSELNFRSICNPLKSESVSSPQSKHLFFSIQLLWGRELPNHRDSNRSKLNWLKLSIHFEISSINQRNLWLHESN